MRTYKTNSIRNTFSALMILIAVLLLSFSAAIAQSETKITADDAAAGDYFGVSVSISGDYAVVGAHGDDDDGNRSGSAYIFVREGDDWTEQAKLTAEDAAEGNRFGVSVSISGDYAVVGADCYEEYSGYAYIFVREGANWTQQAKLTADDQRRGDCFGWSVSISGEYAIVGAIGETGNFGSSGSAYIFVRDGDDWTQQAKLTADDERRGDGFGWSVSISGDYAGIGTRDDTMSLPDSGSAYIFVRDGDDWTQQAKLTSDDPAEYDGFGMSVSISGEYAVVGALGDDDNFICSGAAYIFARDGGDWTRQVKLTADDADAESDYFGKSVSINGVYAVIGAYHDDDDGYGSGSAFFYVRDGEEWTQQAKLTADDAAAGDYFGSSVSISGDYAVVGALYDDDDGNGSGSAYIYNQGENNIEWRGDMADIPSEFFMSPAYPNPFNSTTKIIYTLPFKTHVSLGVYDPLGRRLTTLFEGVRAMGSHEAVWNAQGYPAGAYNVRFIQGDEEIGVTHLTLLK